MNLSDPELKQICHDIAQRFQIEPTTSFIEDSKICVLKILDWHINDEVGWVENIRIKKTEFSQDDIEFQAKLILWYLNIDFEYTIAKLYKNFKSLLQNDELSVFNQLSDIYNDYHLSEVQKYIEENWLSKKFASISPIHNLINWLIDWKDMLDLMQKELNNRWDEINLNHFNYNLQIIKEFLEKCVITFLQKFTESPESIS